MRSFQEKLGDFESRGVRLVAISVDPIETTRKHIEKLRFTFTFLSDERMEVLRRYDLVHPGGFRGADIARPAEFLLAGDGTVVWRNLTESYKVRARGDELLQVIDSLKESGQKP